MAARGERLPDQRVSPPGSPASAALHGRDPESARIRALIDAARAGRGGVLVVDGEPGSGKTALIDAVAANAAADGWTVLRAGGIDSGAELAFSGLTELLAPLTDSAATLNPATAPLTDPAELGATLNPTARAADPRSAAAPLADPLAALSAEQRQVLGAALNPAQRAADPASAASPGQLLLGTAVLSLLSAASAVRPLLLWVDDIHWLDGSSLSVLGFVARRVAGLPIALVVARRGVEPAFGPPGAEAIHLAGLDEAAAWQLLAELGVAGRGPRRGPGGLRLRADEFDRLLAETRGNPLALIEMVRLAAAGTLDLATLTAGREPLPSGVQLAGLYHDQVVTLPGPTRSALITVSASFTGEAGPIAAALLAADLHPSDLAPAEQQGLVEMAAGRVDFPHPLLRSAVYHGASDESVRDAHRRLAEALAAGDGPAAREQHAWHRSYAVAGPDAEAAEELAEVAAAAARRGALTSARQAYRRAALIAPDPATYLIEAAVCARIEGDADEAVALLDAAEEEGLAGLDPLDPDDSSDPSPTPLSLIKARIQAERARVELSRAEPGRLMTELVTAATQSADRRHAVALTVAAAAAGVLGAHYREAREIASQALAHALDPASRAAAAALSGHINLLLGDREAARELTDAALADFDPGDVAVPIEAAVFAAWTRTLMRDWSPATHQLLDQAIRAAQAAGALSRLPPLLAVAAELNQRAGHWDVALTRAQECVDLGVELGQTMSPGLGLAVAARITAYRGDRAAHAELRRRAATLPPLREDHPVRLALRHAEAVLLLDDDPRRARRDLESIQRDLDALGVRHPDLVPIRADLDEARDTPHEPAEEPESDPFLMARRALRQATALRERRHHAEARSLLEPAREIFRRLKAARWDALCEAELAKLSGADPTEQQHPPKELTQYEVQVARRVGTGATNNEAAAALFISPKTVEYHLRNLYRKLGIRSRTELARIVAGWNES